MRLGDVIVAVDETPVEHAGDLFTVLQQHRAGDTVTLTILRDGQQQEVKVTLGAGE
jgi:S1-C subfamily serine protease